MGEAIREKFHWVPRGEVIDLVMDNAGGHGRADVIEEYVDMMMRDYKINIVWQEPRSPETNLLDLGVWMSLQSWVEKTHHGRRSNLDALAFTCMQAWNTFDGQVFQKVYDRWEKVLKIIVAKDGGNDYVDERGKLFMSVIEDRLAQQQDSLQEVNEHNSSKHFVRYSPIDEGVIET